MNQFSRSEILLGKEHMARLQSAHVAVFGVGGVGSFAAEALARSGVGALSLFDDDRICLTNVNRQLIATLKTVGRMKVDVMKERVLDVNPKAAVHTYNCFYGKDNAGEYPLDGYDYVIDAVDTVTAKLLLIERARAAGVPIISCMGAGNKLDASGFVVADIYETSVCPLAKVMRRECRARGIERLKVVYSTEPPVEPTTDDCNSCKQNCVCPPGVTRKCTDRRAIPGSVVFAAGAAGLVLAGEVVRDLHVE